MVTVSCGEAGRRERGAEPADIVVDVGDGAVVGAPRRAHLRRGHRRAVHVADVPQPPLVRRQQRRVEARSRGGSISSPGYRSQ